MDLTGLARPSISPIRFDLVEFKAVDNRWKRSALYIQVGATVMLALIEAYGIVTVIGVSHTVARVGIVAFLLIWGALLWNVGAGLASFLPGAKGLELDDSALHFDYASNHRFDLSWADPKFRLTLYDYSAQPAWVGTNRTYMVQRSRGLPWFGPYHRRSLLTKAAFENLLAAADVKELSIRRYRANALIVPGAPVAYEIASGPNRTN